uniref:Mov34/MPN/PAD-1 family protein n=1 Tax=Hylemonella sp. TaxID=2066020 RepID=UPI00391990A8
MLIEQHVLARISTFRQVHKDDTEAGGILLGFRRGEHLHIVDSTTPMTGDLRTKYSFDRRDPGHQVAATNAWKASNGCIDYLGEWHTHPESHPKPSSLDLREWRNLCRPKSDPLMFLILGIQGCWLGLGDAKRVVQ